eukprot:3467081-Lingulodinium_polyedra.AAC.1
MGRRGRGKRCKKVVADADGQDPWLHEEDESESAEPGRPASSTCGEAHAECVSTDEAGGSSSAKPLSVILNVA